MEALGVLAAFCLTIFLGSVWSGYVLTILWGWFIVPVFHLPALLLVPAMGLGLVVRYLTHQYDRYVSTESSSKQLLNGLVYSALAPALMLGIGAILVRWMP